MMKTEPVLPKWARVLMVIAAVTVAVVAVGRLAWPTISEALTTWGKFNPDQFDTVLDMVLDITRPMLIGAAVSLGIITVINLVIFLTREFNR